MALVDYDSSSESEAEGPERPPAKPTTVPVATSIHVHPAKKPFQKVVSGGKILVALPGAATDGEKSGTSENSIDDSLRPAKRARVEGGGRFSSFNSFLPAPKNRRGVAAAPKSGEPSSSNNLAAPGINLKTSAAPGFSRGDSQEDGASEGAAKQPTIPEGQKPESEVKLVGTPLMFRPLSVARGKKGTKPKPTPGVATSTTTAASISRTPAVENKSDAAPEPPAPPPKKVSLFSIPTEVEETPTDSSTYTPLFETGPVQEAPLSEYEAAPQPPIPLTTNPLAAIADEFDLSASQRRELLGRASSSSTATTSNNHPKIVTFNTDAEYAHNEELRTSGDPRLQQTHNPLRAIMPGKHSLKQIVQAVQSQTDALEESFAAGRRKKREAGARYGW